MDKEHIAIARLQEAARTSEQFYKKPLVVTTSGGKDSSVCVELALRAGIDFELMHNHTTADAPETVRFLRSEFKRLEDMGFPSDQIIINYPVYKGLRTSIAVAAAAEAAMQAAGWEKRGGRDICALCRRIERETGKLPVRVRYDLRRTAEKGRAEEGQA